MPERAGLGMSKLLMYVPILGKIHTGRAALMSDHDQSQLAES